MMKLSMLFQNCTAQMCRGLIMGLLKFEKEKVEVDGVTGCSYQWTEEDEKLREEAENQKKH